MLVCLIKKIDINQIFTFTVWSKWSKCSQSCGEGIKIKFRICNNEIECKQEQKVETCLNRQCGKGIFFTQKSQKKC